MTVPLLATGTAHAAPSLVRASVPAPPQPSVTLPAAIDVAPSYQGQTTCDPTAKPGPIAFAKMLNTHYGTRSYGVIRACGSGITEHSEGRALDWMINAHVASEKAIADAIVQWLSASDDKGNPGVMARRFGINYIIWNRQVWRAYAPERGWANYTGSSPHTDHIHITFTWDGAYQRTSWWTGVALQTVTIGSGGVGAPAPSTVPVKTNTGYYVLRLGSTGEDVSVLQRALNLGVDGSFGPLTHDAARSFQSRYGLTVDGVVGQGTWSKLIELGLAPSKNGTPPSGGVITHPLEQYASTTLRLGSRGDAVTALQRALGGLTADGVFGAKTDQKVKEYQRSKEITADGVVNTNVWNALMGKPYTKTAPAPAPTPVVTHPLEPYATTTIRRGSRGAAVTALQRALGGLTADGVFGALTEAKIKSYQQTKELTADGVVSPNVWNALMGKEYTKTAPGTSPAPAPTPGADDLTQYQSVVLRLGSRSAAVAALQRALGGLTADGVFGAKTDQKVKEFQRAKDLVVDGVVGRATWAALIAG